MDQTHAGSPLEARAERTERRADALAITLGVDRMAFADHGVAGRGAFHAFLDFVISPDRRYVQALPLAMPESAEPALLLTEADFAPPEHILPILERIAMFAALALAAGGAAGGEGEGGAAYVAQSLIS